jgi:hypothetical protein|nr:MAG TPA: Nuclease [Caudoviricetes sp.]
MREKDIEQKLVKAVKQIGGMCLKFTSPGFDGVPDRLVLLPLGRMAFVELKAPGKEPRPLQLRRIQELSRLDFPCYVVDNEEMIGGIIDAIQAS